MKFLRLLFLSLSLLFALNAEGKSMHALLIGIGNYPEKSMWGQIDGNNDIPLIEAALLRQGFPQGNIIKLIDDEATKKGILDAFDELKKRVGTDDVVYIHFSGHGQQVTDLDGDEEDGYDEAWVPYDAGFSFNAGVYEGENHIIDDELNAILTDLRRLVGQAGKIVVVADTCHSGTSTRGMSVLGPARGAKEKFIIPRAAEKSYRKSEQTISWLSIEACKPHEYNFEYMAPNGEYYGTLSYIIANDPRLFSECDWEELKKDWERTAAEMTGQTNYQQTLQFEGKPNQFSQYIF